MKEVGRVHKEQAGGATMPRASSIADRYRNTDNDPRGPYVLTDLTAPIERPALQYSLQGYSPPTGRSWRYAEQRAQELVAEGRIIFRRDGLPRLKRYLSETLQANDSEKKHVAQSSLEILVRTAMKAIAEEIARNPECLRAVEWRDLERVLREVFEGLGFTTQLTRSAKDGGFDLQLQCVDRGGPKTFFVEVKHWISSGKKVGSRELSALVDIVAAAADSSAGLLLSSSGFTVGAVRGRSEIERHSVRMGGQQKIVSLCQHFLESPTGLLLPLADLPEVLFQGTC